MSPEDQAELDAANRRVDELNATVDALAAEVRDMRAGIPAAQDTAVDLWLWCGIGATVMAAAVLLVLWLAT